MRAVMIRQHGQSNSSTFVRPRCFQQRRRLDFTGVENAPAMETEYKLTDQQRGIVWEYRVKAVNKASIGPKSSTVMAVL